MNDKRALLRCVEENRHRVYTLAYYHLGRREDAEDVTQEAFLRLCEHWADLEPERRRPWLLRVTKNACIDAIRKRGTRRKNIVEGVATEAIENVTDGVADPSDTLLAKEQESRIKGLLAEIDEPYKTILILREIEELSYAEIAKVVEAPVNRIKVYLHRGRAALRTLYKERTAHEKV